MKQPGLLWMVQTAVGLSMAAPMVVVGVEFLRGGRYGLGAVLLVSGVVALFAPSYVLGRIGGPRAWLRRRLRPRRFGRGDEDAEAPPEEGSSEASASTRLRGAVRGWRR